MIDKASVFAERFKSNPQILQATVLGQGPDPNLDPYTALRALQLIKESNAMAMAQQAQGPTSAPSLASQAVEPQGLAGMLPMGAPAGQMPQGQAPQQMAQAPAMQASGGLAGLPTSEEDYAEGGIVAFQSGGLNAPAVSDDPSLRMNTEASKGESSDQDEYLNILDELQAGEGSPAGLAAANALTLATARRMATRDLKDLTPAERRAQYTEELKRITEAAGPSPFIGMRADLAEQRKERSGNLEFAKGEALLEAAAAVLEGNNAFRGLAKGGAQFAKSFGAAKRADDAAKRSIAQIEFYMADAERKERMGNSRAATAAVENARKERLDLNRAELTRDIAMGRLATDMGRVNKPGRAAGAGDAGNKLPQVDRQTAVMQDQLVDLQTANPNDPKIPALETKIARRMEILTAGKEGPSVVSRATAALTAKQKNEVAEDLRKWETGFEARKARLDGNYDTVKRNKKVEFEEERLRDVINPDGAATTTSTPKPKTVINYDASGKRIN